MAGNESNNGKNMSKRKNQDRLNESDSNPGVKLTTKKSLKSVQSIVGSPADMTQQARQANPIKSVGSKLFLIIFGSIVACVLTVGLMAYSEAKKMIERKVSEASLQTVNQVTNNLDVIFKTYEDISLQLIIDKDFHDTVRNVSATDDYSKFEAARKLSEKLQGYIMASSGIRGMMLLPQAPGLDPVTAGASMSSSVPQLLESEWYDKAIEYGGRTYWIPPQEGGLSAKETTVPTIGLSRLIKDSTTSTASYVLLIEIEIDAISEYYDDVKLSENSELAIVDGDGNYVIADDYSLIGNAAKVTLPTEGEFANSGAPKLTTTDGVEVLAAYNSFAAMDWKFVGTLPVEELVKDAKVISRLTWITVFVAALIAIAIGIFVIITIAQPLVKLRNLMGEGARGNLTVHSTLKKRGDEIGQLSDSFNEMMTQIKALAIQTTGSAEEVLLTASELTEASRKTSISAREIAIATEEIANGATSLAVEAEKGSDLTGNINAQMKNVIEANQEMVLSAAEVEKASGQGTDYMAVLIEKTGMTEDMTRSMVEKVDALKESTSSIVKILDVLNSVAKQTNILSLNATIEAARAGAAGRGFMVVADEIRKLADQSRQSIDIVAQITENIQSEIDETVVVLSEAYPLFQEQIGSVKEANQIFLTVQGQMGQLAHRLELVTSSIGALDESQSVLSEAMTNVSAVAEEASATSEEVASLSSEQLSISDSLVSLSEKLDAVSRGLKDSLSQFRIE